MSTIYIDPNDGMLSVKDSYADKERCSTAGCFWDSETKTWKMIFTLSTLDTLLNKIPHAVVDPSMKKHIEDQKKKEDSLIAIKKMSDENKVVDEIPQIFSIGKKDDEEGISRRSFVGMGVGAAVIAGSLEGCAANRQQIKTHLNGRLFEDLC